MANTGLIYSASAQNGAGGGWLTPGAAAGSTHWGSNAGAEYNGGKGSTGYLQFLFAFSLPLTAHITGLFAEISLGGFTSISGSIVDHSQLLYLGSAVGTDKGLSGGVFWGMDGDTWGIVLTPSMLNDPTFGMQFTGTCTSNSDDGFCAGCRMTVYYATPATPPNYACFKNAQ